MILARAPVRICFGGGGSDLPSYYERHGGWIVSAAIDQHIYVGVARRPDDKIKVSAGPTTGEVCEQVENVTDAIIRRGLARNEIEGGVDVVSFSDIPAKCGLGTSGSFTVCLLAALRAMAGSAPSDAMSLADEASEIELVDLGLPVGRHDQYVAAYGGLIQIEIAPDGTVTVDDFPLLPRPLAELNERLWMFYTGKLRSSSDVLKEQDSSQRAGDERVLGAMESIVEIGQRFMAACKRRDWPTAGRLMHHHWEAKKLLSGKVSDPQIDEWYELGLAHGALGGKVIGAGGGGHLLFFVNGDGSALENAMERAGLRHVPFAFEHRGCEVVYRD